MPQNKTIARLLAGDTALFAEFENRFQRLCAEAGAGSFIAAKQAERVARHRRYGETPFLVEPNIKEGKGGLRDLQQGMTGLFEGVVQTNLRVAQELFRLANPAPIVELQQRFVREYTDTLVQNSATLVRAVRRTADETLRPLEEQIRQSGQDNQSDARFNTAAE